MKSIAIVTDSNSGITQQQAEQMDGVFVLPMPFSIDGETFYEGITLERDAFYERLNAGAEISTSQPAPQDVLNFWNRILKAYETVIHIPMSSGLSGSCDTAFMLSAGYEGKVLVVDNQRISVTQRQSVLDAVRLRDEGKTAQEIYDILMETKMESSIYIMVDTLKYLKKGGRVTPAAAALGALLRIKPVLQIQGEKLDAFAKVRTLKQAKQTMTQQAVRDTEGRYADPTHEHVYVAIAHTENREEAEIFRKELSEIFSGQDIYIDHLSLSVACHIGPGSLAVALCKKII